LAAAVVEIATQWWLFEAVVVVVVVVVSEWTALIRWLDE
jgi:hypothetical protein